MLLQFLCMFAMRYLWKRILCRDTSQQATTNRMSIINQVMQNKATRHGSPVVKRLLICTYTFHKRDTSLLAGKIGSAATGKIFPFTDTGTTRQNKKKAIGGIEPGTYGW